MGIYTSKTIIEVISMSECGLTNLASCLPERFFEYIVYIINAPIQALLNLFKQLLTQPANIEMFYSVWAIIVYMISLFYGLFFLYAGFQFMISGYDAAKRENAKEQTTLSEDDEEYYIRGRIITDLSLDQYKSPLNITLLSHAPERNFVELLVNEYSKFIDGWIKSKDKGFYSVPYIHRPGTHSLQKDFNPDFFFKKGDRIIVVEIKSEDDSTIKNKDKLEGATTYFNKLNEILGGKSFYDFHFLDPRDYKQFFENKFKKNLAFKGSLHADLETKSREELKEGR